MGSENAHAEQIARREIGSFKRISAPCAPRVIVIGFDSIPCLVKAEEGEQSLPAATPSQKQNASSKFGITSTFEKLLSWPRHIPFNNNFETVSLGLVTESSLNSDPQFLRNDDSSKSIPAVGNDYVAPGMTTVRSCSLDQQQSLVARSKLQRYHSSNSKKQAAHPRNTENCVPHKVVEVAERRVFSFLATSPQTLKGRPEHTSCLATMDFMKSCFLCKRQLKEDLDIFMYKGDKAFCSEECRYQQIESDERAESRKKFTSAAKLKRGSSIQFRSGKTKVLCAISTALLPCGLRFRFCGN